MVVLDTDHVSILEERDSAASRNLRRRLDATDADQVATTIISFEEQTRGWLTYISRARTLGQQVHAYQRLRRHLDTYRAIHVLDFDEHAAVEFQKFRNQQLRIGTMDLRIAAIVLVIGGVLLSRNIRDFGHVPELRVEDWTL